MSSIPEYINGERNEFSQFKFEKKDDYIEAISMKNNKLKVVLSFENFFLMLQSDKFSTVPNDSKEIVSVTKLIITLNEYSEYCLGAFNSSICPKIPLKNLRPGYKVRLYGGETEFTFLGSFWMNYLREKRSMYTRFHIFKSDSQFLEIFKGSADLVYSIIEKNEESIENTLEVIKKQSRRNNSNLIPNFTYFNLNNGIFTDAYDNKLSREKIKEGEEYICVLSDRKYTFSDF